MDLSDARPLTGVVSTVLGLVAVVGLSFAFCPCDGSGAGGAHVAGVVPSCVWAQRAMVGSSVVALVLSLVRTFELDEGERRGLGVGIALSATLAAIVPGTLIALRAGATMRCRTAMAPFGRIVCALVALAATVDLVRRLVAIRVRVSDGRDLTCRDGHVR